MKKTLTVNLGGTVFHIDEDAYQLLDNYLKNLKIHFQKEEGADEILNDFESRISELFSERIRLGYEVITIEHVETVINRMGNLKDLFDNEEEEANKETQQKNATDKEASAKRSKKRLMRDPDNRILGGIASGIAAYLGCDVTWVRLAMILLFLCPYTSFMLMGYLILWLVMPKARTATDRLEMRGESVTIENIGKTITDGFEKASDNINDYMSSEKPRSALRQLADVFVSIVGFVVKFFLLLIGVFTLPILAILIFIVMTVGFALIAGGTELIYDLSPFAGDFLIQQPAGWTLVSFIGLILLVAIPLFALVYAICGKFFNTKPMNNVAKWVLLVLWLIAFAVCGVYLYQVGTEYWSNFRLSHGSWHIVL